MFATVLLYFFAFVALASGLNMVIQRNPVHGALSLLATMLSLAGMYALMQAHLIAALQIIIYAGAIIILIVYIIMLLDVQSEDAKTAFRGPWIWSLPILGLFALLFARAIFPMVGADGEQLLSGTVPCADGVAECERVCDDGEDTDGDGLTDCKDPDCGRFGQCYGTVEGVGASLLGPFVLPFEVTSILLLAGIVGSVLLTGRRPKEYSDDFAAPAVDAPKKED